jgi:hypothetical protein
MPKLFFSSRAAGLQQFRRPLGPSLFALSKEVTSLKRVEQLIHDVNINYESLGFCRKIGKPETLGPFCML